MTLYRDAKVAFGGMEVGGIRISHMSHIERDLTLALTVTKAKRAPFRVQRLAEAAPTERKAPDAKTVESAKAWAAGFVAQVAAAADAGALTALLSTAETVKRRAWLVENVPGTSQDIEAAIEAAIQKQQGA
jgi:hypothetical protein